MIDKKLLEQFSNSLPGKVIMHILTPYASLALTTRRNNSPRADYNGVCGLLLPHSYTAALVTQASSQSFPGV